MAKEKGKTGDTPEELDMLFRKNRIYQIRQSTTSIGYDIA